MMSIAIWGVLAFGVILLSLMILGSITRRRTNFDRWSLLIFLGILIFITSVAFQISMGDLDQKFWFDTIGYIGLFIFLIGLPPTIVHLSEEDRHWILSKPLFLVVIPTILTLAIITDPYHHLFYASSSIREFNGLSYLAFDPGPLYMVMWAYLATEIVVLTWYTLRTGRDGDSRVLHIVTAIALLIPLCGLSMSTIVSNSVPMGLNVSVTLMFTASLLYIVVSNKGVVGLATLSMMTIMKESRDGLLVLDLENRVVRINQAGERYLSTDQEIQGEHLSRILPELESKGGMDECELEISRKGIDRWMRFRCDPILNKDTSKIGSLVILTDVTEERLYRRSLEMANKRLALLTSITGHDIQNQIMVIDGYVHLYNDGSSNLDCHRVLERIAQASAIIIDRIRFSSEYSQLGGRPPAWQRLDVVTAPAMAVAEANGLAVHNELDGVEVFADMLLRRVFDNLLENSLQHGRHVTSIVLSKEVVSGWLEVSFADNGVGIPNGEKDIIFEMGHGSNTGVGLYLCKEIMESSGASIMERGVYGQGATFVLRFPPKYHRPSLPQE